MEKVRETVHSLGRRASNRKDNTDYVPLEESTREVDVQILPIVSNKTEIPRKVCDAVIQQLHQRIRDNLDWKLIWPHLNKKKLLSAHQTVFIDPSKTDEDKWDHLIAIIPECSQSDYLTPFVKCLLETHESGVGLMHDELLREINQLWTAEMADFKATEVECRQRKNNFTVCHHQFSIKGTVITGILMFIATLGIVIALSVVITKAQYQASMSVLGKNIVQLNDIIRNQFTSSVSMKWNRTNVCTGEVISLSGQDCFEYDGLTKLDSTTLEDVAEDYLPLYMLQNSSLSIFIPRNGDLRNAYLNVFQSIEKYYTILSQSCCISSINCKSAPHCYQTDEYLNSSINISINESDFYNILLMSNDYNNDCNKGLDPCILPRSDYSISYQLDIVSFNYTYIRQLLYKNSLQPVPVKSDTVKLSTFSWFNFHPGCYLLNYTCDRNANPASDLFVVSGNGPRGDIIFIIFLIYVFLETILLAIFIWKCHKRI